jgi:hypothetical protein
MSKLTFTGPTREADAEAARAAAVLAGDAAHVHVIPAEKTIYVYTSVDAPVFDPRPTVSKWQLIQACADAGITETQIDTAVALLTNKRQRFWKYTQVIDRDNPFSSNLRTKLVPVPTPAAWNAIFLAAAALDPTTV